MCGIVGYVGKKEAAPIVLSGLRRLEYRGYDSAGVAAIYSGNGSAPSLEVQKKEGRIDMLAKALDSHPLKGTSSIGHTRWATHGKPSEKNAHPHRYKDIVIVHNGIIENHISLKEELAAEGHKFTSETDSEVIAHLLQSSLEETSNFEVACRNAVKKLRGAYAFAALWLKDPNKLFVAKQQCPMVLGVGKDEQFIASDIPALLEHTKDFIFLEDGEIAFIEPNQIKIMDLAGKIINHKPHRIEWSLPEAEKEGFEHFMRKEIYEQPRTIRDTVLTRILPKHAGVHFEGISWDDKKWSSFTAINLVACGTAWHSCLVAKYWIEKVARIQCEVDLASEFRYRDPVVHDNSLCIAVSQSGETADTLAAVNEAKKLKQDTLAVTNMVESSVARKSDQVIYTFAGPEVSVASTKSFMGQLTALFLLGLRLAQAKKTISASKISKLLKELEEMPEKIEELLKSENKIKEVAQEYLKYESYFYLGRGLSNPLALEGALKLKEIAYINTQAYAAGEMKHGPIALISDEWAVVCVNPDDKHSEKMTSNIEEVKARGGRIIAIGTEGNNKLKDLSDAWLPIPKVSEEFTPFLTAVVLQLYSYHMSVLRGCDVDKPKNLAKSVTVE
jgi:glucosamine--fructose-6-phosphate aminotransferase (isomerizing)